MIIITQKNRVFHFLLFYIRTQLQCSGTHMLFLYSIIGLIPLVIWIQLINRIEVTNYIKRFIFKNRQHINICQREGTRNPMVVQFVSLIVLFHFHFCCLFQSQLSVFDCLISSSLCVIHRGTVVLYGGLSSGASLYHSALLIDCCDSKKEALLSLLLPHIFIETISSLVINGQLTLTSVLHRVMA